MTETAKMKPTKILVAGRDAEILSLVETRLKVRKYEVFLATHSDEAVRLAEKMRFDLVLISTSMDEVGHMDLCLKVKQVSANFSVPVILIAHQEELRHLVLSPERGFDDFLLEPFDAFALQLRVELNLLRARERLQANPLTNLPGTFACEENIKRRVERGEPFSVCYLDIDHFKSFNDRYGFERGDAVIKHTARILNRCLARVEALKDSFVGHIGGDDFIVALDSDRESDFAHLCLHEFDRIMPTYYDETDRKRRSLFVKNRSGVPCSFPLMSISIAAVCNKPIRYSNLAQIARVAAEVKEYLKTQPGSHYLRDRRTEQLKTLEEISVVLETEKISENESKPFGQHLLEAGLITEEELIQAVGRHVETGERLGQVLIRMNLVATNDIGQCLAEKMGVEYVSLKNHEPDEALFDLIPWTFVKRHQAVPIALESGALVLAMVDPLNQKAIGEMKEMCALPIKPRLALENEFDEFLEKQPTFEPDESF